MPLEFIKVIGWCVLVVVLLALKMAPHPYAKIVEIWKFFRGE